jgi:gliding motility-associated-like protein
VDQAPFDYEWTPLGGNTFNTNATSNTTSLLSGGTYTVLITDANSCTYTVDAFIAEPDSFTLEIDSFYNPTCVGATNGFITIFADGGNAPLSVVWDNGQTGLTATNLGVGTHCAAVIDDSGCSDTVCFTLSAPLLTDSIFDTICQGESYLLPSGITITPQNDTSSVDSLITAIGCDSIVSTFLTVHPVFNQTIDTILCIGESFLSPSGTLLTPTSDTTYIDSLVTINNCDSIFNINITVQDFTLVNIDTTVCQGQSISVNGVIYTASGTYLDTAFYASGCDSIRYTINLQIDSFTIINIDTTLCQGQSITVNGINYGATGSYNDTLFHASGCDSIQYVINVQIDSFTIVNIDTNICQGQTLTVNGVNYTASGTYNDTLFYTASGCDSIQFVINLNIDSFSVVNIDTTICQGQSLSINGVNYTQSGSYNDTAYYASGCDSIQYIINLQIDSFTIITIDTTICQGQSITVNGVNYNATGIYNDTIIHVASGCDSIQYVIDLQVDSITNVLIDTTLCAGDTLTINGVDYGATGNFTDTTFYASGCIDTLYTINILAAPLPSVTANTSDIDSAACINQTLSLFGGGSPGLTFTWNNGVSNNTAFSPPLGSTTYIVTGTDANNCSNTDTITILGLPTYNQTVNASICEDENYVLPNGNLVNTAGSYPVTLTSSLSCDSTITTILTVNQIGTFTPLDDVAVCDGFSQTIEVLSSNMTNFEWFVNDGSGTVSLLGNPDYLGANTASLNFNLDISLHQNVYTVAMVDECGNPFTSSMTLSVYEPHPVANPLADTSFCLHEISAITVDYNGFNYVWNTGQVGQTIVPDFSGEYIVEFTENVTNCELSDTINVELEDCIGNCVVLAPTGFSPNASGSNDIFRVVTTCDEGFSYFLFNVYNRWGELIYTTDDWRTGWDGTYKGRPAEIGTYTFYVEYTKELTNKKEMIKGNVTLIR